MHEFNFLPSPRIPSPPPIPPLIPPSPILPLPISYPHLQFLLFHLSAVLLFYHRCSIVVVLLSYYCCCIIVVLLLLLFLLLLFIRGCHMVDIGHSSRFFNLIFCFLVFFCWMNRILFRFINLNCCRSYLFSCFSNLVLGKQHICPMSRPFYFHLSTGSSTCIGGSLLFWNYELLCPIFGTLITTYKLF